MANETVSFEITANTQNAGKAITELQRKLNAIARIKTDDAGLKKQQKEFEQINKTLGEMLEREGQLGRHYTTYDSRAKRVAKLTTEYKDQDKVLQENIARQEELQAKSDAGTITPKEVNELSRVTATIDNLTTKQADALKKINAEKKKNETLDKNGKKVLAQLVSQYGEIKSDESSILGLKVEQVKGTEQEVQAQDKLETSIKKTNNSLENQAQSAKKANTALSKAGKKRNTKSDLKQIVDEEADAEQKIYDIRARATKALSQLMGPDKFDFGLLKNRRDELEAIRKEIESIGTPKELHGVYDQIVREIDHVKEGTSALHKEIKTTNTDTVTGINQVADAAENSEKRIQELRDKANSVLSEPAQNRGLDRGDIDQRIQQFEQIQTEIKKLHIPPELKAQYNEIGKELVKLKQQKSELDRAIRNPVKPNIDVKPYEDVSSAIQQITDATSQVERAMNTDAATKNIAELLRRVEVLQEAKKAIEDLGKPVEADATYNKIIQLIATLTRQINNYKSKLEGTKKSGTEFSKTLSKAFNAVKSSMSSMNKTTNKIKSSFDSMARSMRSNFKHMITSLTKYVLGFRSLFFLVRRLRKYIGEGIQNLAKFNGGDNEVNRVITDLLSSLLYLKNAWAAAFSPVIIISEKWLPNLIDRVAEVGNAIARLVGGLLGQEVVFNAVKVRAKDYADTLDNTGSSAGGAADKVKKLTDRLAAFDDLNVLGVDNDPDKTGSGGGSGLADAYEPDPNEMFTIVKSETNDLIEMLKKAWENADFKPVGEAIKDKIIGILPTEEDWEKIKEKAGDIGKSFGTFMAGLFGDPKLFEELGRTFGEGLNTINTAIQGYLDGLGDTHVGENLAKGFNEFLDTTDWETAGDNINRIVTGISDNIKKFLETLDTDKLVSSIEKFLTGLDIKEVAMSVIDLTVSASKVIVKVVGQLVWDFVDTQSDTLKDALWKWVTEGKSGNVVTKDGAVIPFKINLDFGVDGEDHPILTLLLKLLGGVSPIETGIKLGFEFSGLTGVGDEETIRSMLDGTYDWGNFFDYWIFSNDGTDEFNSTMHSYEDGLDSFATKSKDTYDKVWADNVGIKGAFQTMSEELPGIWETIVNDATTNWNTLRDNITGAVDTAKTNVGTVLNTWKETLSQVWYDIRTNAVSNFWTMKAKVEEAFTGLKDGIKGIINNGIIPVVENMINYLIDGLNSLVNKLNSLPDVQITNPLNGQSINLGISLPTLGHVSIPRLAQGAVIPPNKEFMAMLGDQSHGTNIEAPLDTIKQAVAEVIGNNNNEEVVNLLQQLITVVENKNLTIGDKEIGKANARYNSQQRIIRGTSF